MRSRRITEEQRQRIIDEFKGGADIGDIIESVKRSDRAIKNILEKEGLLETKGVVKVKITNNVEDYTDKDEFWIDRIKAELWFKNFPDGLTMEFGDGRTAKMYGTKLIRDDGMRMILSSPTNHKWVWVGMHGEI